MGLVKTIKNKRNKNKLKKNCWNSSDKPISNEDLPGENPEQRSGHETGGRRIHN